VFRLRPLDLLVAALVLVSTSAGALLLVTSAGGTTLSSGGLMAVLETMLIQLYSFPPLVMAQIAGTLSAEQWVLINRILKPVDIPYLPFHFSALMYACFALTALISTVAIRKLVDDSAPYVLYNR